MQLKGSAHRYAGAFKLLLASLAVSCVSAADDNEINKVHKLVFENEGFAGCSARTTETWCNRTMSDGLWCGWVCTDGACECKQTKMARPVSTLVNNVPFLNFNSSDYSGDSAASGDFFLGPTSKPKKGLLPLQVLPELLKKGVDPFKKLPEELIKNVTKKGVKVEFPKPEKSAEVEKSKAVTKETCFTVDTSLTQTIEFVAEFVLNEVFELSVDLGNAL